MRGMSDRSSADIFATMFLLLDSDKTKEQIAQELWKKTFEFDFSCQQLEIDDTLVRFGLARKVKRPDYPDETITQYRRADGRRWDDP